MACKSSSRSTKVRALSALAPFQFRESRSAFCDDFILFELVIFRLTMFGRPQGGKKRKKKKKIKQQKKFKKGKHKKKSYFGRVGGEIRLCHLHSRSQARIKGGRPNHMLIDRVILCRVDETIL